MDVQALLTHVQEAYVSLTKIGLFIVNDRGEYITTVSGIDPVTEYLFTHNHISLKEQFMKLNLEQAPTDAYTNEVHINGQITSLKQLMIPIVVNARVNHYIVTNIFGEQSLDVTTLLAIINEDEWKQVLPSLEKLSVQSVYEVVQTLQKMAKVCASLLAYELGEQRFISFQSALYDINKDHIKLTSLFDRFLATEENIDLLLHVQLNRQNQWVLNQASGKGIGVLKQVNFEPISQLLWETKNSSVFQAIENIQFDPRLSFLYTIHIRPKAVYFFPIINELENKEIIIAISENQSIITQPTKHAVQILAEMIALFQAKKQLKNMGNHYLMKISRAIEMSKLMLDLKNIKELLFLILDMTDHLMKSTFVAVVLKDQTHECLYCDQISKDETEDYLKDVWDTYFNQVSSPNMYSKIRSFAFGNMIECPIIVEQKVEAVFCIHADNITKEMEAYTEILANLLSIGLARFVGIQVAETTHLLQIPESIVKLLTKRENEILEHMVKGHNNQEIAEILFISAHTVKNHISNIFQKLNITDRRQLFSTIYQLQFYT